MYPRRATRAYYGDLPSTPFLQLLTACSLQFNDHFSTQTDGGILVYYVSASPGDITAFQPVRFVKDMSTGLHANVPYQGFRMLVGDPMDRERPADMVRQNCFRCYTGPDFGGDTGAPCMDDKYVSVPFQALFILTTR